MYGFRNFRLFFGIPSEITDKEITDKEKNRPYKPPEALDDRIKHFEVDADKYKLRFRVFQVIVILASGIIPIVNLSDIATPAARVISSILGSLIIIVTGFTQMDKNHEMWILKASVEHALKREKLLFLNGVSPYTDKKAEKRNATLAKNMNDIISSHLESYFNVAAESRRSLTNRKSE
jgi:hypothetical protein